MRAELIGKPETIISNPDGKHNYFAWPTVALLQNGVIAVGASGFRLGHICPFGKGVIAYSRDGGKTYTRPAPVIDTPLDDRDAGICTFGERGVIFTSFNNSADMQREHNKDNEYVQRYIDTITKEDEEKYLGSTFKISNDCGVTFGEIHRSPITSPHGPTQLRDGSVIWAGTDFNNIFGGVQVRRLNTENGETELIGVIKTEDKNVVLNEPHMIELQSGKLICHIRGENASLFEGGDEELFTVYQSVSRDGGKSWSEPVRLLDETGGAPPHLIYLSSGVLLSTYGRRKMPYGIMAMVSLDGGESWEKDIRLYETDIDDDIGYPSTVELENGELLTVFYAPISDVKCVIMQQKWKLNVE